MCIKYEKSSAVECLRVYKYIYVYTLYTQVVFIFYAHLNSFICL